MSGAASWGCVDSSQCLVKERQDFRKQGLHVIFRGWESKDVSLHNSQYSEVASGIFWDLYSAYARIFPLLSTAPFHYSICTHTAVFPGTFLPNGVFCSCDLTGWVQLRSRRRHHSVNFNTECQQCTQSSWWEVILHVSTQCHAWKGQSALLWVSLCWGILHVSNRGTNVNMEERKGASGNAWGCFSFSVESPACERHMGHLPK